MPAEAGPGPSSMASSPVVPGSAKQLRVKKRVINIVNPADPDSFSIDNLSVANEEETAGRAEREVTPVREMSPHTPVVGTPLGSDIAKRGILRSSGTPGSGNGVRFFPKNRFRIITPNHSLHHPSSPAPAPPSIGTPERRRQSLLTQLLAVAMPSVSPEKPIEEEVKPDESWEVPGQEGEISLIASSNNSMQINEIDDEEEGADEDYVEEATQAWDGMPEIHSSPLGLPVEGNCDSRDISQQDLEPSNDWGIAVPDDMSNLLHEKWSPTDPSFSISDPPQPQSALPHMPRPTRASSNSPMARSELEKITGTPGAESTTRASSNSPTAQTRSRQVTSTPGAYASPAEEGDSHFSDVGATVRKRSTPPKQIDDLVPLEPSTPTPAIRPSASVFAEMSAEQADLSWPLRRSVPDHESDETAFQSAIFDQLDTSPLTDLPRQAVQTPITPRSSGPGEKTAYFDCSDSSFAFSPLSIQPSPTPASASALTTTVQGSTEHELVGPTRDLFAAQFAHSNALAEEVKLYRDLASKLHNEVIERDTVLAELNGRVLEGEVLKCQVDDLRAELERVKAGPGEMLVKSRARSTQSTRDRPLAEEGDRTTVVQAETRDLEIRLSKALAEQGDLRREMDQMSAARREDQARTEELEKALEAVENRHRDQLIAARQSTTPPPPSNEASRVGMQEALERCRGLELELTLAREDRAGLQSQLTDMREVKLADEEEIARLNVAVEGMRQTRRDGEVMRAQLEEVERRLEGESRRRAEMEQKVQDERDARRRLEAENKELLRSLQATRSQLAHTPTPDPSLSAEVSRLRSESASKDLEITSLRRRKAELKEDREMLNIALDSKQQELELIKRKHGLKGRSTAAGTTPLGLSNRVNVTDTPAAPLLHANTPAPGKSRRRSSALGANDFITPSLVNGDKRALRSAALLNSASVPTRVVGQGQENSHLQPSYGSVRRERMLA